MRPIRPISPILEENLPTPMISQLSLLDAPGIGAPKKIPQPAGMYDIKNFKIICLQEKPSPRELAIIDTPEHAANYWREFIEPSVNFNSEVEQIAVILLNTRRRATGFSIISMGSNDTVFVHPREVFRPAVISNAAAILLGHNHPSGDPTPSEADIRVTRDLIRAGQLLKIDVADHIIVGHPKEGRGFCSLRELGYFC